MAAYDLVVIGSGPAGEKGAAQAAYFGKRVVLVEREPRLGGAGINTGTIPSKALRETALYFSGLRQRGLYGIDYSLREGLTVQDFMFRKRQVLENEWRIVTRNMERHQVEVVHGEASLKDPHTVLVRLPDGSARELTGTFVLIATGSSPFHPEGIPFDGDRVHDSDSILLMRRLPQRLVVVGGGVIGCEYAALFTALGAEVIHVASGNRLLGFVDGEIAERLRAYLENLGLRFVFNDRMASIAVAGETVRLTLNSGEQLEADTALFAAGRTSNVEGLNLEAVGVQLGARGLILVNDHYQTSVPNIYAAGDVIGFPALASTSMEQARVAMAHAFDLRYKERVSPVLPLAVYTIPEIAQVGLTEEECRVQNIPYLVGRSYYDKSPRGQIIGDMAGMLKLIFAPDDKRLLGAHHIGELASELVHIGAHVLAEQGTIDVFIRDVYTYPSLSDSYKYAAYDGLGVRDRWVLEQAQRVPSPSLSEG